jgi:hypothetical protein
MSEEWSNAIANIVPTAGFDTLGSHQNGSADLLIVALATIPRQSEIELSQPPAGPKTGVGRNRSFGHSLDADPERHRP